MSEIDNQEAAEPATTEGQAQESVLTGDTSAPETPTTPVVDDWKASLPDDLKGAKSLQSIQSVEDLAKGFVNAQSVVGRRFEDLTPEQIDEYYTKAGRPEAADNYELELPEGVAEDDALVSWFKGAAFESGLTNDAASGLFNQYMEMSQQTVAEQQAAVENRMNEEFKMLKEDFGPAFDERVELANRAISEFGGDELVSYLAESGLQNNPQLVKFAAKAGMMLAEGKFSGGETTGKFGMSSEEAAAQIETLRKDPEFMNQYTNQGSPKHKEAVERMENLYKTKIA